MIPQITVLDTGGQYCHLIARRVRELGVYADVQPSEIDPALLRERRGVIISGGPASAYEPGAPTVDAKLYSQGVPVLGICYGLQLMSLAMGGEVRKGDHGEYGRALLKVRQTGRLLEGFDSEEPVWMSHRDLVSRPPEGFQLLGETSTCPIAAIGDDARSLYGIQFHPEVVHTQRGRKLLENFLFSICRCERDWNPNDQLPAIERQVREVAGSRSVLFFASGGVDSTVAFAVCLRALGRDRVHAAYVDTGLMREGETEFVRSTFEAMAPGVFEVVDARREFLAHLDGITEPERKRHLIGEEFVAVQERILERGRFLDGQWILGQGTIYPDTIESGGTQKAETIKTHHNRVLGIQRLIEQNRIIEPLRDLYKDEVRILGRTLGLPAALLDRHPFPGPGLAIRCLCSPSREPLEPVSEGFVVPIKTVGVQGDSRTYRAVLALDRPPDEQAIAEATAAINRRSNINRVVGVAGSHGRVAKMSIHAATITSIRLDRLRRADAIVRRVCQESGFEGQVWQFPVVLIPMGDESRPDSVVLRPIQSVDGMTANAVALPADLLKTMTDDILAIPGVAAVLCDLTHKPPATIEWE